MVRMLQCMPCASDSNTQFVLSAECFRFSDEFKNARSRLPAGKRDNHRNPRGIRAMNHTSAAGCANWGGIFRNCRRRRSITDPHYPRHNAAALNCPMGAEREKKKKTAAQTIRTRSLLKFLRVTATQNYSSYDSLHCTLCYSQCCLLYNWEQKLGPSKLDAAHALTDSTSLRCEARNMYLFVVCAINYKRIASRNTFVQFVML